MCDDFILFLGILVFGILERHWSFQKKTFLQLNFATI